MPSLKSVSDSITNARRELEQLDAKLAKYHGSGNRCGLEIVRRWCLCLVVCGCGLVWINVG